MLWENLGIFFSNFVLKILSELCSNFFDGFVLGFRDFEPNVADKEDLQNDENDENVGSNRQLKKKIEFFYSLAR